MEVKQEKTSTVTNRVDLIFLARFRKLPETDSRLWQMSIADLKRLLTIPQVPITDKEQDAIYQRQSARKNFRLQGNPAPPTKKQLVDHLRGLGRPTSALNRDGLIDRILLSPLRPAFLELDEDQQAVIDRIGESKIYVSAGPGSGKTLTCGRFAMKALKKLNKKGEVPIRILVLVYSRAAKSSLEKAALGARIPKTKLWNGDVSGVAIVTFHEFAYRLSGGLFATSTQSLLEDEDSYRKCLESAVKSCQACGEGTSRILRCWSQVIVDEAQDLTDDHWSIVDAIVKGSPDCKLLVAGDPRQSLYEGTGQFVKRWLAAVKSEKAHLRYNHRSARGIVEKINLFSEANFPPEIHKDQIPTSSDAGLVSFIETDCPASAIANCFNGDDYDIYVVAPITTDKWGQDKVVLKMKDEVFSRFGCNPTRIDSNNKSEPGKYYGYATARKIKGTERGSVVVFGVEQNYSFGGIPDSTLLSAMFVALSRARHTLTFVRDKKVRHSNDSVTLQSLNSLSPTWGQVELKTQGPRLGTYHNVVKVSSSRNLEIGSEKGLAGVKLHLDLPISKALPTVGVGAEDDEDFVGYYVEAMVAEELGAELGNRVDIDFLSSSEQECRYRPHHEFWLRKDQEKITIVCCCGYKSKLKNAEKIKEEFSRLQNRAYASAFLRYSVICQKPWTPSGRLAKQERPNSMKYLTEKLINVIYEESGEKTRTVEYLRTISMDIKAPRCSCGDSNPPCGIESELQQIPSPACADSTYTDTTTQCCSCPNTTLTGEVDLVVNGIPVEIKHTATMTDTHRRQAAIYAKMMGCEKALLVNTKLGRAEWVKLGCTQAELFAAARCIPLMRYGKLVGTFNEARLVRAPDGHNVNCEIFIDVETDGIPGFFCDGTGYITEMSAVAVIDGNVHSVFTEITDGVRPVSKGSKNKEDIGILRTNSAGPSRGLLVENEANNYPSTSSKSGKMRPVSNDPGIKEGGGKIREKSIEPAKRFLVKNEASNSSTGSESGGVRPVSKTSGSNEGVGIIRRKSSGPARGFSVKRERNRLYSSSTSSESEKPSLSSESAESSSGSEPEDPEESSSDSELDDLIRSKQPISIGSEKAKKSIMPTQKEQLTADSEIGECSTDRQSRNWLSEIKMTIRLLANREINIGLQQHLYQSRFSSRKAQEMTKLEVVNTYKLGAGQEEIRNHFSEWVDEVSANPCFVHWGGGEGKLLNEMGYCNTADALKVFKAYSGTTSLSNALGSAVERVLGPHNLFVPHRSSEDAAATMAVWMAIVRRGVYFNRKRGKFGEVPNMLPPAPKRMKMNGL